MGSKNRDFFHEGITYKTIKMFKKMEKEDSAMLMYILLARDQKAWLQSRWWES